MTTKIKISDLPSDILESEAIEACFAEELNTIEDKLREKTSVLIEANKEITNYLILSIRRRVRRTGVGGSFQTHIIEGNAKSDDPMQSSSALQRMVQDLTSVIQGNDPNKIIVLPHLDLLCSSGRGGGLTELGKEVTTLIYQNPEALFLAFKDPSMSLPTAVSEILTYKESLLGVPRHKIRHMITQAEGRKFGVEEFNPFILYKYLSGVNPSKFRKIMRTISSKMDYDPNITSNNIFNHIRKMTVSSDVELPDISLENDIGGYSETKRQIREEILDLYTKKDSSDSSEEVKRIESLLPKGVIFEGPPGTGKTFFAKAMASALDATAIVVSGPELKSKWVGESEANLRQVFRKARANAPSIIIFDEIDSFAQKRGSQDSSGVQHSMVNQLLTEMDGFRKDELVFIVATTNFAESLDSALLRPGRFELVIEVPYPNEESRKEIIDIYNKKLNLNMSEEMVDIIVSKTDGYSDMKNNIKFSGDHLNAICRGLKRRSIRLQKPVGNDDVEAILNKGYSIKRPAKKERNLIAVHECGHAIVALFDKEAAAPNKISIESFADVVPGYTIQERKSDFLMREEDLFSQIAVFLGGRAAEFIVEKTKTSASSQDLISANKIATLMVQQFGMGETLLISEGSRSASFQETLENNVRQILSRAEETANKIIEEYLEFHKALTDALMEKEVLLSEDILKIMEEKKAPDYVLKKLRDKSVIEEESCEITVEDN